jgi:hypothetical protein
MMHETVHGDGDMLITVTPSLHLFAAWVPDAGDGVFDGWTDDESGDEQRSDFCGPTLIDQDGDSVHSELGPEALQMTVSSKHLEHASPRFKTMLAGGWLAAVIRSDGFRHVDIEGFEPKPFSLS